MAEEKKSISRAGVDPAKLAETAANLGILSAETDLELKNEKKEVVRKITFRKLAFEDGDMEPSDKFAAAVSLVEALYPEQDAVLTILAHLSASVDLAERSYIRSREAAVIEGPGKAMEAAAKKLAAQRSLTMEEAMRRVQIAWA